MGRRHGDLVRESFTEQAKAFEDGTYVGGLVRDGEWILRRLHLDGQQLALDVAAGTGHAARGVAPHVRSVVAVDATPAMLAEGQEAARAAGLQNVVFQRGDAAALPFLDASFDVVVCRFAIHHFEDPPAVIAEIVRCTRPGGQVLIADLTTSDDPTTASNHNRLETIRDPSHVRCLSADGLREAMQTAGLAISGVDLHETTRPLHPWLAQTRAVAEPDTAQVIEAALRNELGGGPATGLGPQLRDGELWFVQRFAAVTAHRTA